MGMPVPISAHYKEYTVSKYNFQAATLYIFVGAKEVILLCFCYVSRCQSGNYFHKQTI